MLREYEAMFLFKGEELDFKNAFEEVKSLISKYKGKILSEKSFGERALYYPIKKEKRGRYEFLTLEFDGENLLEFENSLKLVKGLLRKLLVVKITRKAKKPRPVKPRRERDNFQNTEKEIERNE